MKAWLYKIIAAAGCLTALLSCGKDIPEDSQPAIPPIGYTDLVRIYRSGIDFISAESMDVTTLLTFDGEKLSLRHDKLEVHDDSNTNRPPIILSSDGYWMVGGKNTGIKSTKGRTLEGSFPVYVYLYGDTLHMFASNGEDVEFPHRTTPIPSGPREFTMPSIHITHHSDRVHRSYYIPAEYVIRDPDKAYSEFSEISGTMQIRGRGQSTWDMPKKPYKLKFDEKSKVLGMRSNKDWALLANYTDKSLLRNAVAMRLSEICGMSWTPAHVPVEVYLNNSYLGVYDLFEGKEVADHKVEIDVAAGDYYLEIEQNDNDFATSKCNVPINFKDPEREEISNEQFNAVRDFFNKFESVLYGAGFADPVVGYAKYIDVNSFIDNYIIEELAKDIDGNVRKSSFVTIAAADGGKIKFCHQWDFDLSFGNADYFPSQTGDNGDPNGPKGWWIKDFNTDSWKGPGWYPRLFQDPAFVKKVKARWNELYPELCTIPDYIEFCKTELGDAPSRNFRTWNILRTYVWPNVFVSGTYEQHVEYMSRFYSERLNWLNQNIQKL